MDRKKSVSIIIVCLIFSFAILFVYVLMNKPQGGFGIRNKKIESIQIYDDSMKRKEITNVFDKQKLVSMIRSLNVKRVPTDNITGVDYGLIVKYDDGVCEAFDFQDKMLRIEAVEWYKLDKSLNPELKAIYNKEQMTKAERIFFALCIIVGMVSAILGLSAEKSNSSADKNNNFICFTCLVGFIATGVTKLVFNYNLKIAIMILFCLVILLYVGQKKYKLS